MTPELRRSAPAPLSSIAFDAPKPVQSTLDNGLRVSTVKDERLPLVSFRLVFNSGDIDDPKHSTGLISAATQLLTEGTEQYSSLRIAEMTERIGASLSAHASDDFSIVSASALSLYSSDILSLMADVILRPSFPENELDLYRRNTIENLKFQRSQPPFLANEQVARSIYGEHPYSVVSPKASDIERLNRDELSAVVRSKFVPNDAMLIAVGDIEPDELIEELNGLFADWLPGKVVRHDQPALPIRDRRTLTIVDRPGSAQSNIVIANRAIQRLHPDFFPLLVMNQILGAGASSRVFMNLREEKGYTYGAYTRVNTRRYSGDVEATAEVRNEVTGDSLKEFFCEFDRIRNETVDESELSDAKTFLTGVFPIRAETQEGLTNMIVNQQIYGLPDDYLQTYRNCVNAVSAEDVRRAAIQHVRPDEMAIVIVGDANEVLPQAEKFAESVEVFDTNGAAIKK